MSDLISMKMRDGSEEKLKIMEWISSHKSTQCLSFAHKLLNDRLSVKKLRKKYSEDDEFVQAVLDKWVSRDDDSKKDSLPCTWDTLVQCVDESGLDGDFLKLLKDNVSTGMYTSVVCVQVYVWYVRHCMYVYISTIIHDNIVCSHFYYLHVYRSTNYTRITITITTSYQEIQM